MLKKALQHLEAKPRTLFLIDGLGAFLSAFLLGVVLVRLEWLFGIPASVLYFLAVIPLFFAGYDLYAYRQDARKSVGFLKGIALLNLLYCTLSIGLGLYHQAVITCWGWSYIASEVAIIAVLVWLELKVATALQS